VSRRGRSRQPKAAGPAKAAVAYIPSMMFAAQGHEWGELSPLAGCLRRFSNRAAALLTYFCWHHDFETGLIQGCIAEWSKSTEHGRDPKTLRLALAELLGNVTTPDGACLAAVAYTPKGKLAFSREWWKVRLECRGRRHTSKPGPYAPVRISATVYRGGPWQILTDAARKLYAFMRQTCAAEFAKDTDGNYSNVEARKSTWLAERTGLCSRTVLEHIRVLEHLRLIIVRRKRFSTNTYQAPFAAALRVLKTAVDATFTVDSQLKGQAEPLLARCVEYWHRFVKRRKPVRLALELAT